MRPRTFGHQHDLVPQAPESGNEGIQPIAIDLDPGFVEHEDGTLIASSTLLETGKDSGPVLYGVLVVDLERRTATHLVAEAAQSDYYRNGFRWLSPSGRYGIRFHCGSVPWHDGRSNRGFVDIVNRMLGKGGRTELPDCRLDGVERIGIALEVWQIKPLKPMAKPVVRMQPVDTVWSGRTVRDFARAIDFSATKPGAPFRYQMDLAHARFIGHPRKVMNLGLECLAWEPDETAFWVLIGEHEIRRITIDSQISPLAVVPRIRDSRLKRYGGALFDDGDHVLRPLGDGRICIMRGGDQIVRVPFPSTPVIGSGIVAAEESFAPGMPLDLPAPRRASEQLAFFTKTFIEMPDLSETSVVAAIEFLTDRIAKALPDMVHRQSAVEDYLRTVFFTPTHVLNERAFFDFAAEHYPAAIPGLRRLITTYCQAPVRPSIAKRGLYYSGVEGALAHAALALARFDPDAVEPLSAYITSPNVGQTSFIRDDLAPAYSQHQGWRGDVGVRLGVRFAVNVSYEISEGVRYLWEECGLRDAARQLSPELFADILLAERKIPKHEIDKRAVTVAWIEVLQDTDAFDAAVRSALLADCYSTGAETIIRVRDVIAFIEATFGDLDWKANAFRLLQVRNMAYALISAREFGDLIVIGAHSRVGEKFEDRTAARIIQVIRAFAETLDTTNDYDAEVLQILRKALNDVVARLRPASTSAWFAHLLLGHLEWVHRDKDQDSRRDRAVAIIEDLCRNLDPSQPFDADVIAALDDAKRLDEPWKWHG